MKVPRPATRQTVLSYLDDYAQYGSALAFAQRRGWRTVRCSYEELAQDARRLARELAARGIGRGDRVLLCGENSPGWAAGFWGCLLRGAVVVPLDKESAPEFARSVQRQTEAKLLLADERTFPT